MDSFEVFFIFVVEEGRKTGNYQIRQYFGKKFKIGEYELGQEVDYQYSNECVLTDQGIFCVVIEDLKFDQVGFLFLVFDFDEVLVYVFLEKGSYLFYTHHLIKIYRIFFKIII